MEKRIQQLEQLLNSMIADIEAMQDKGDRFGPFSVDMVVGGYGWIEWPNLRILLEEAKAKMEELK